MLSKSAFFLQAPRTEYEENRLREHHRLVSAAQQLLSALPKLTFASTPAEPETPIEESFDFGIQVKQTQRDRKNAKKRALQQRKAESGARIDNVVFTSLGFDPPASKEAADEIYANVLGRCRDSLEVRLLSISRCRYLRSERRVQYLMTYFWVSAPKDVLRNTYIPVARPDDASSRSATNAVATGSVRGI